MFRYTRVFYNEVVDDPTADRSDTNCNRDTVVAFIVVDSVAYTHHYDSQHSPIVRYVRGFWREYSGQLTFFVVCKRFLMLK